MSEALTAIKTGASLVRFLNSLADPGKRRALDEAITEHVLGEIPRIRRLLEERIADVSASGCTPLEASIIAHQVIEAQKRTLDPEKRRRLSNVLVNGLCSQHWDKAKHRLLIRLASELEEEHIAVLQWYAYTPEERQLAREREEREHGPLFVKTSPNTYEPTPEFRERCDVHDALMRELVSCGMLIETPKPRVTREPGDFWEEGAVQDVELDWSSDVSPLGLALLAHLKDPEDATESAGLAEPAV